MREPIVAHLCLKQVYPLELGQAAEVREALAGAGTGVVLVDIVLGYGAHSDPAGEFVAAVSAESKAVPIVASVCGTEDDAQVYSEQVIIYLQKLQSQDKLY